jgi:hypothetical protein
VPALAWYAWAYYLIESGGGSRASADNRDVWAHLAGPTALFNHETALRVGWFLLIRAFSPIGAALAIVGFWKGRGGKDRLFQYWAIATFVVMLVLAAKLHHEYYWLFLAPVAAYGIGIALDRLASNPQRFAALAALGLLCIVQVRSTWRIPADWIGLESAGRTIEVFVPPDEWIAAPEALLYEADRRGCRMEWTAPAARRAAGEWQAECRGENGVNVGQPSRDDVRLESLTYKIARPVVPRDDDVDNPMNLVEFYRERGARYFADLGNAGNDPRRMDLHEFVRRRYKVIVDSPEVIIADLVHSETRPHAN